MTLPFKSAASPAPAEPQKLITMDWQGTLDLRNRPNKDLYIFAAVAQEAGHKVVVTTNMNDWGFLMLMKSEVHPLAMQREFQNIGLAFPQLPVYHKDTLQEEMRALGHEKADISFDNEPETIPGYIKANFMGAVDVNGKVEDIVDLAAVAGIRDRFIIARQMAGTAPLPGWDHSRK